MNPRTVLITGATKGLGLEFVKQFAKREKPPKLILAACLDPLHAQVREFHFKNKATQSCFFVSLYLDVQKPSQQT